MAGLVGLFGTTSSQERLRSGLDAIRIGEGGQRRLLGGGRGGYVGVVARHAWEVDSFGAESEGILVSLYGSPLVRGSNWRRLGAREAAARYRSGGMAAVLDADGFFSVTVLDSMRRKAYFAIDHCGSAPLLWTLRDGAVAFAPEAKALFSMLSIAPEISELGLVQVMNVGFVFGDGSIFRGVKRLEPAQVAEFDLGTGQVRVSRYWEMDFSPSRELRNERHATAALFEAVGHAQQAVPATGAEDVALALTGGFDSRLVLGTRCLDEDVTYRSFSWGVQQDLPLSDPAIARQLAEMSTIPHRFMGFNAARVPHIASQWVLDCELLNANMGYFAAGRDFLRDLPPPELILTGDHVIGLGAIPSTVDQAIDSATGVPVCGIAPHLAEAISPAAAERVRTLFAREVRRVVERAPCAEPKAVQDYLYFHIHAFGWLFSAGFYKEPVVSAFRPLLLRPIVEMVARMPVHLRSDKLVLVKALRRYLPDIARLPIANAFSLIDWGFDAVCEPKLREFLLHYTSEEAVCQTPLGDYLDHDAYLALRSRFFANPVKPVSRRPSLVGVGMDIRRWLSRVQPLRTASRVLSRIAPKGVIGRPRKHSHTGAFTLLSRVALVSLLQEAIDAGSLAPRDEGLRNGVGEGG